MGGRSSNSNLNLNRRSAGNQASESSVAERESANQRANIGENSNRMRRIENVREQSEQRRVTEEARRQNELGTRTPSLTQGQRISNVSYERAQNELYNAPVGTVIQMDNHNTGDYVGEYTRTATGWQGSQQYRSNRARPVNVTSARGFAMQVSGNDIRVLQTGTRRRR